MACNIIPTSPITCIGVRIRGFYCPTPPWNPARRLSVKGVPPLQSCSQEPTLQVVNLWSCLSGLQEPYEPEYVGPRNLLSNLCLPEFAGAQILGNQPRIRTSLSTPAYGIPDVLWSVRGRNQPSQTLGIRPKLQRSLN